MSASQAVAPTPPGDATKPAARPLTVLLVDDQAIIGESVRRIAPFTLILGGAGAFPSARRASVLWIGVAQGGDDLEALASAVTAATAALGFESEDRSLGQRSTHRCRWWWSSSWYGA